MLENLGWKSVRSGGGSSIALALLVWMLVGCGYVGSVERFDVAIGPVGAYVPRAQSGAFLVTVQRHEGFSGQVVVGLRGDSAGVTAAGLVEAGAEEGELLVFVDPDAPLGPVVLRLAATGRTARGVVVRQDVDFVLTVLAGRRPTLYLVGAAGSPPPAEVYEEAVVPEGGSPWLLELVVWGGVLVLDEAGRYEHLLTIDTLQDGRLVGRSRWADHGVWAEFGAELSFDSAWIDGHAFTGARSGAGVVVDFDLHPFVGSHVAAELVFAE